MPRTSKTADKTLSVQQAADQLGVARLHVWRLVEQGEIPSVSVDDEKRIRRSDLPAVRKHVQQGGRHPGRLHRRSAADRTDRRSASPDRLTDHPNHAHVGWLNAPAAHRDPDQGTLIIEQLAITDTEVLAKARRWSSARREAVDAEARLKRMLRPGKGDRAGHTGP